MGDGRDFYPLDMGSPLHPGGFKVSRQAGNIPFQYLKINPQGGCIQFILLKANFVH
jgi:hypothetical protein